MVESNIWHWIAFNGFVLLMLILDLRVFHRNLHKVQIKEALIWTGVWITLALIFNYGILHFMGKEKALEFLTGYLIEKSLSVDNIFVFIFIFSYFHVPAIYQHKILFWGIIGALIMRVIFIFAGFALISHFHWTLYIFSAFLVFTGIRMFFQKEQKIDPGHNPIVRLFKKIFPITNRFHEDRFFIRQNNKIYATPLAIVVLVVEGTDLIFAIDSIPAILAISKDPFIVYTSNVFAILGLRSLYFALEGMNKAFRFLKYGLSLILIFIGIKMFLSDIYPIPIVFALVIVASILLVSVMASIIIKVKADEFIEKN